MPEPVVNFDPAEFERLLREALVNLFDQAALSRHPFAGMLDRGASEQQTRGQQLRELITDAIERLQPVDRASRPGAPEGRPYLLLRARFVEGASPRDIQELLGLSERQLRRDQARAIQALAAQLWDVFFPGQAAIWQPQPGERPLEEETAGSYAPVASPHDVAELLDGVLAVLQRRADEEDVLIELQLIRPGPHVLVDRIILRQVLLSLLSYALDARTRGGLVVSAEKQADHLAIHVDFEQAQDVSARGEKNLQQAQAWSSKIGATLLLEAQDAATDRARITLTLPAPDQGVLLIVDDQETAVRMFQRYLMHVALRPVGLHNGAEAVEAARRLQPRAVMLDIMMPHVDGWEVLQSLQADPATAHIPIIICSVWEEPELATSLGAADFLKKPITQKDLLAALDRLHLLGSAGELR